MMYALCPASQRLCSVAAYVKLAVCICWTLRTPSSDCIKGLRTGVANQVCFVSYQQ